MKTRQVVFGLVGIIALAVAFEVGRRWNLQMETLTLNPNKDRRVTISASPDNIGKCEVDYPVAFLRQKNRVQWASNDNKYWVSFLTIDAPPGYTPENPLVPTDDPVVVDPNHPSKLYNVKLATKYYMYAIFDHDPTADPKNPCKAAVDDHDPGLNVKP